MQIFKPRSTHASTAQTGVLLGFLRACGAAGRSAPNERPYTTGGTCIPSRSLSQSRFLRYERKYSHLLSCGTAGRTGSPTDWNVDDAVCFRTTASWHSSSSEEQHIHEHVPPSCAPIVEDARRRWEGRRAAPRDLCAAAETAVLVVSRPVGHRVRGARLICAGPCPLHLQSHTTTDLHVNLHASGEVQSQRA